LAFSHDTGCTESACISCCEDAECEAHKEARQQTLWNKQILSGTTWIHQRGKDKRAKLLPKGRFREPGFTYLGDTVVVWNVREYLANPKWKEDALRKANKRTARAAESSIGKPTGTSRKRFRRLVEDRYQTSLV
jgi:hypothetical protein